MMCIIDVPDLRILTESNEEGKPKKSMADAIMMVRRNVIFPNWRKQETAHLNVLRVLQETLMSRLGVG